MVNEPQALQDFLKWKPKLPKEIISNGVLYEGGKAIIYGRYKTYKSMLAIWLSYCLIEGKEFLGFKTPTEGTSVLYLQLEISHPLLHERAEPMWVNFNASNGSTPALTPMWVWTVPFLKLDTDVGIGQLSKVIQDLTPDLIIIDPLYKVISNKITDPNTIGQLLDRLDVLASQHNFATIIISHPRKPPVGLGLESNDYGGTDDLLGAGTFSAWADSVIRVVPKKGVKDVITIKFDTLRHARQEIEDIDVYFERTTLTFQNITVKI